MWLTLFTDCALCCSKATSRGLSFRCWTTGLKLRLLATKVRTRCRNFAAVSAFRDSCFRCKLLHEVYSARSSNHILSMLSSTLLISSLERFLRVRVISSRSPSEMGFWQGLSLFFFLSMTQLQQVKPSPGWISRTVSADQSCAIGVGVVKDSTARWFMNEDVAIYCVEKKDAGRYFFYRRRGESSMFAGHFLCPVSWKTREYATIRWEGYEKSRY